MTTENTIYSCHGLSIILPVYNGESYINEAIDSCLNQNLEHFELIIVDDGSTDSTYDYINKKAKEDNHLVIIHKNANEGLSAARNTGIDYARYEYLTFLDADDKIKTGMYQEMLQLISATETELVVCNVEVHHVSGKTKEEHSGFKHGQILKGNEIIEDVIKPILGFKKCTIQGISYVWNKIFRKSIIDKYKLRFNEQRQGAEDWQFVLEYIAKIERIVFLSKPYYEYWHHSLNSLVFRYRSDYFKTCILDRMLFRKLWPMLDWDSERCQKDWDTLPVRATFYYRKNLCSEDFVRKIDEVVYLCKEYARDERCPWGKSKNKLSSLINGDNPILLKKYLVSCSRDAYYKWLIKEKIKKIFYLFHWR